MYRPLFQTYKILLFLFAFSFACEGPKGVEETPVEMGQQPEEVFYEASVDKLRIRAEAHGEAEVIHLLSEGERVRFLGEKSAQKERISLRGQEIEEHWFKVSPINQEEVAGWVFGGALRKPSRSRNLGAIKIELREVKEMTALAIEDIFGLKGIRTINEPYSGFYSFYVDENGKDFLQGKFQLMGTEHEKQNSEGYSMVSYFGNFEGGRKEGEFREKARFYEGDRETILLFRQDQCLEKKLRGSAEGEDFEHNYDDFLCSFIFEDYY